DGEGGAVGAEAATVVGGRVAGEGAVADVHRATLVAEAATVVESGVAGEGAVVDAERAVVEEAATARSGVAGEGAVVDVHRAVVDEAATLVVEGRAMSNGEGLEGEGDAAIHGEHLRAVATIEGHALPAAVQGHVLADRQRATDRDGATTTELDRVPSRGAADERADPPWACLATTVADKERAGGQGHPGRSQRQRGREQERQRQGAQGGEQGCGCGSVHRVYLLIWLLVTSIISVCVVDRSVQIRAIGRGAAVGQAQQEGRQLLQVGETDPLGAARGPQRRPPRRALALAPQAQEVDLRQG